MMTPDEEEPREEGKKVIPIKQSVGLGAGAFGMVSLIDLLAHLGPTGLLVAGIAAYVAAKHGPEVLDTVVSWFPTQTEEEPQELRPAVQLATTKRSFLDRALGHFPASSDVGTEERTLVAGDPDEDSHEGDTIDLAHDLHIPKQDLVGKAIFVCGIRRHGKTTLGARLAEQFGKHYIPLFIPCLEGDYLSLADVLPRAIIAGHSSVDEQYREYEFAALDTNEAAYQLGQMLLGYGYQVILDMTSYEVLDQAVAMQINVIRGMFHWANTHPDERVPCYVFLDEAQRYLPQSLSDSVILDKTVLTELLRVYMDIIAIGGKRGIAPIILTQRFAQVNKKIMAQSEVFFLMRQTNDGDLDRCMEYVNSETATKEQIARFKPGQGVYIAADGSQLVTHFFQRESSGSRSRTPQAEATRRYERMPMMRQHAGESRQTIAPITGELHSPARPMLGGELQRALEHYRPGMSYRELGRLVGVGKDKAGELIAELKARGYLKEE